MYDRSRAGRGYVGRDANVQLDPLGARIPGKRTLTESLPPAVAPNQCRAAALDATSEEHAELALGAPNERVLTSELTAIATGAQVQRKISITADPVDRADIGAIAARGVSGSAGWLPYSAKVRR